jgi:ADP-heptose:LPS heptosyltransferase
MGGIILSFSLMQAVKRDYPQGRIFFLTFKKNMPIVESLGIVPSDNILTIRDDSLLALTADTLEAVWRMRKNKIRIAFDLELFSRFSAILTYLSGASKRIGNYGYYLEGLYRGNLLTHKVQYNPLLHTSKSFLSMEQVMMLEKKDSPELVRAIGDNEIMVPKFSSAMDDMDRVWGKLSAAGIEKNKRILLINPGDGIIPLREWPIDNFIGLARLLLTDDFNRIVIIGTEGASVKAARITGSIVDKRCVDLTGKTTINEILGLFNISCAMIVNDCGLAHIASLTPLKKFILFGPESPEIYAPLGGNTFILYSNFPCSPCLSSFNHRRSACRDNRCLKAISVEEAHRFIKERI